MTKNTSFNISIITIAHDGYGLFVPEWLKSACSQQIKPREVIILLSNNHGLTEKLPTEINGITIITHYVPKRLSRGYLRNIAIDISKGEWILFPDVDDIILPNATKEIKRLSKKADVVALRYYKEYNGYWEEKETPIPEFNKLPEWRKYYCNASGYSAFKRGIGVKYQDFDSPEYPFYFNALSKGARFRKTKNPCAIYKKRDSGQSRVKTKEEQDEDFKMIEDSAIYYYNLMKNDRV